MSDNSAPAGAQDKLTGRIAQIASAARQFAAHHEEFAPTFPEGYRESLVWLAEAVHEFEAAIDVPAAHPQADRAALVERLEVRADEIDDGLERRNYRTPAYSEADADLLREAARALSAPAEATERPAQGEDRPHDPSTAGDR